MAAVLSAVRERQGVFEGFVGNVAKAVAVHVAEQHAERTAFSLRGGAPEGGRTVALPRSRRGRAAPYAALLPDGGVAGEVFTTSINSFLNIYNTILIARLVLTWFPNPPEVILQPLATLADPYLGAFRGLIPPLGGLDLSPILAFTVLNVLQGAAAALPAEMKAVRAGCSQARAVRLEPLRALSGAREKQ